VLSMKRLAVLACALGVFVGCDGDIGTVLGNGDTVSADLDLVTIDGEPLPFLVPETGNIRIEVLQGTLTLRSDRTWERFSRIRILNASAGSSQNSDVNEGGTYTLEGETLTLELEDPNEPPLSGTFSNGQATVQLGFVIDYRDPDPNDTSDLGCAGAPDGLCLVHWQGSWLFR